MIKAILEEGENLISRVNHIIYSKCLVLNKKYYKAKKEIGKYGSFTENKEFERNSFWGSPYVEITNQGC